jgi:hypothetical protein
MKNIFVILYVILDVGIQQNCSEQEIFNNVLSYWHWNQCEPNNFFFVTFPRKLFLLIYIFKIFLCRVIVLVVNRRPLGFDPKQVSAGFVVEEVTLTDVSLRGHPFSQPVSFHQCSISITLSPILFKRDNEEHP